MQEQYNVCSKCGNKNPGKNRFCIRCGEQISPALTQSRPGNAFAAAATTAPSPVAPTVASTQENREFCTSCNTPNKDDLETCKRCGSPLMHGISIEDQGDLVLIKIEMPQLDFENHRILKPVFKGVMRKKIIIDVSGVKWMDSTGIGSLVTLTYQSGRTGQSIKIVGMNKAIFNAVKALQVDNVLELAEDANTCRATWGLPPV